MTPVEFHFITPEGVPVAGADFEVQLSKPSFDDLDPGVLMPRLVTGTTDLDGKATLELAPSDTMYYVSMIDPNSEAELAFKFYVPHLDVPGTTVRLQDIIVDKPVSDTTYDEAALLVIQNAKANAAASMVSAQAADNSAKGAKDTAVQAAAEAAASADTALKTLAVESDTPPANPIEGQEWTDATSGRRYTWNSNSSCWAETYAALSVDNPTQVQQLTTQLASSAGASMIGYISAAANAQAMGAQDKLREHVSITDFMSSAQRADVKAYGYALDMTGAFAAAIAYLVGRGGGRLFVPTGGYRLDGAPGGDGFSNGILIPSTGGVTTTANGIIIEGEGVSTILRGNAANMMVVRNARLFSGVRNLQINGNGIASVVGYGGVPESITQTTTFTSQSFQTVRDVFISNCTYQIMLQPGPTVGSSDSGGFYHHFNNVTTNISGTYDVWFRPDPTGANNRTTRTTLVNCRFLRATNSIYIQAATEIDFISCFWELWTGTLLNYVPASSAAANIRLIGGYGESSGAAVGPVATAPEAVSLIGFSHNRPPDASEYKMHRSVPGSVNIAKLTNLAARMTFGYPGFVDLVADPDNVGAKALELQINGAAKKRWSPTGIETFYGSVGNIQFEASGATLTFTRPGNNVFAATAAGASLSYQTDTHYWKNAAGTDILRLTSSGLIALQDNTTDLGGATFRFKTVYAGTGTINTSDGREKQQVQDIDPAAIRAIRRVKFVQFKFNDAVAAKDADARWHFGVIAQQVREAFEAEGLDAFAYGLLCYDEWPDEYEPVLEERVITDDDGAERTEQYETGEMRLVRAAGNRYGVRYDELFALKLVAIEASTI